jgi:hypothetical protein
MAVMQEGRAQEAWGRLTGRLTDAMSAEPVELATVYLRGTTTATETDANGDWELAVPAGQSMVLVFSRIGYKEAVLDITPMPADAVRQLDMRLSPADASVEVLVQESRLEQGGMIREELSAMKLLPVATGNLESILPHIALGTSSGAGGELTSQYNVRGGNYDENLVYVNDFEIYRPQLIRAGQQEGLTFPNIDLVQNLVFSAGGFEARYGDKQSSVLDIRYKRPERFGGSAAASLLGGSAHLEGSVQPGTDPYKRLRYLAGIRYKTTRYLLGTLDVEGEYNPDFADVQAYLTYDLHRDWQLGCLLNYNRSNFYFVPSTRSTAFGLVNYALELFSEFEGQERDDFTTQLAGLSLTWLPDRERHPVFTKLLVSAYRSDENERFDIIGRYSLRQIESDLGSGDFGEVVAELGAGTQHQYVRNFLDAVVATAELKGGLELERPADSLLAAPQSSHFLQWGLKYQLEDIRDRINEWERLDSAGYSLPYDTARLLLYSVLKTQNRLSSRRLNAYFQDTYTWRNDSIGELKLSAGVRAAWWDLNREFFLTPRAQLLYKSLRSRRDISWRLAAGLYYQPPFYRELRNPQGLVNRDVLAQKSAHIVGGFTYDFFLGRLSPTRFRLIMEAYYKRLWDIVSYEIDNVRIRYEGANNATGYVTGVDLRLNGEFVPGVESWVNLSFLRARERLEGVAHRDRAVGQQDGVPVRYVPRPSDQLLTLSVFFQDYLPRNEHFKMNLSLFIGTGLPYGLKDDNRIFRNTYRFKPYHRVDIGFSLKVWDETWLAEKPRHPLRFGKASWLSLEIFNLMQVQNEASRTWIKTVFSQQFAIPNYLTGRRLNLRWRLEF